jgi:hypothetical protein
MIKEYAELACQHRDQGLCARKKPFESIGKG